MWWPINRFTKGWEVVSTVYLVVFDTVMVGGVSTMLETSYLKRLGLAKRHLHCFSSLEDVNEVEARASAKDERCCLLGYKDLPPILLRVKPTFSMENPANAIRSALHIVETPQKRLRCSKKKTPKTKVTSKWPTDGLIFTPSFQEVQKETHDKMIKVKDLDANTVDFRLVVEKRPKEKERLLEFRYRRRGKEEDICAGEGFPFIGYNLKVIVKNTPALQSILARFRSDRSKSIQSTIVECQCILDVEGNEAAEDEACQETLTIAVWNERKDKAHPNSMTTLYGTLETLHTGIGSKEILDYFQSQ